MTSIEEINDLKAQVTALREALEKIIKGKLARDCMCNGLPSHVWHDLEYCRTIAKEALATPSPAPETKCTCMSLKGGIAGKVETTTLALDEKCPLHGFAPTNEPPETEEQDYSTERFREIKERLGQYSRDVVENIAVNWMLIAQHSSSKTPETGTVCPCYSERHVQESKICKNCLEHWNGNNSASHCTDCTTPGCVDGRIQEGTTP